MQSDSYPTRDGVIFCAKRVRGGMRKEPPGNYTIVILRRRGKLNSISQCAQVLSMGFWGTKGNGTEAPAVMGG